MITRRRAGVAGSNRQTVGVASSCPILKDLTSGDRDAAAVTMARGTDKPDGLHSVNAPLGHRWRYFPSRLNPARACYGLEGTEPSH